MKVLGIDPGLSGGIAFYDVSELHVFATPVFSVIFTKNGKKKKRNEMDLKKTVSLIQEFAPDIAILESVTARPGQGSTSMFRFGENLGQYEGILSGLHIPFFKIRPQKWKAAYSLHSDKNDSLALARVLFPDNLKSFKLKKNDGMAEAALMAKYGYDNYKESGLSIDNGDDLD